MVERHGLYDRRCDRDAGPTPPTTCTGPRPADPAPGVRLPLPDMRGVLAQFSDASQSCPRGLKYVNNPWQDR